MEAALRIIRVSLAGFFLVFFLLILAAAMGSPHSTGRILLSSDLLLFAIMGNYLSILRPNYFLGIRTPWT